MKRSINLFLALVTMGFFLATVLTGCGYTTRSLIAGKYKTINIAPFVNKVELTVEVDPERMEARSVTVDDVRSAVQAGTVAPVTLANPLQGTDSTGGFSHGNSIPSHPVTCMGIKVTTNASPGHHQSIDIFCYK